MDRTFGLTAAGTSLRTEALAGLTTFLTMAYILFVNPGILGEAGMARESVFVATAVAAIAGSAIMGLYANLPVALAPGMGLNAYFAFVLVLAQGYTWQQALAAVFLSGVLFVILSVLPVREAVINAIPRSLKLAVSAGIGFFLGIIALKNAGIVVANPATFVALGDLFRWPSLLCLVGFVLMVALTQRRVLGATIIGILAVSLAGLPLGLTSYAGIVALPPSLAPTLFALDFSRMFELPFLVAVLSLLFVDLFDTAGTLVGVCHRAGLLDREGRVPRVGRALLADSSATVIGALVGTSNTTSYVESAAGAAAGGRTGLTAVVVAALFGLALFFSPLAGMIPAYATAAALLHVATIMARGLAELDWEDATEYAPAVVCAFAMPLTFSIATGIGLGFITYAAVKLVAGRLDQASPAVLVLAAIFCLKFALA
ncbi:NCS2 family permease [Elioraea sp.]|uniref:NCS2 family permease n=1 Tax=Elioraea sp. TaxID=2185103 RepID=UPI0021DD5A38|nr:NCS2 family permease [Elioraea sp.]GIX10974.1 MAG: adenine permease [Elioraea sp.]